MKAITRFPFLRYPVASQEYKTNIFGRKDGTTAPLRVDFGRSGVFESDSPGAKQMYAEFARRMSTPEQQFTPAQIQMEVERYLLNHEENVANGGFRFHIVEEDSPLQEETKVLAVCVATRDGGELCGKPAVEGHDYCAECLTDG